MLAAALLAIDPTGLGGAFVRGRSGPARDAWLAAFRDCLPANAPVRKIPSHAGADRLIGGLDLPATLSAGRPILERGILASADGGVLILASSERFGADKAALVAAAMDGNEVAIARDGFAATLPSRFALIAFDESESDDEKTPGALTERLAFHVDLEPVAGSSPTAAKVKAARRMLTDVVIPDAIVAALCETAMALGIASPRAALFAVKAARAHAALHRRRIVSDDDAAIAARLVLAPRATVFPQAPEEQKAESESRSDADDANETQQTSAGQLSDVILEAVKSSLPPGLLAGLVAASAMKAAGRSGPGASAKRQKGLRGRTAGTRAGDPRNGSRLNLVATLRAAAPWQRLRTRGGGALVKVRREDFRVTRYRRRSETTAIFAVDASGSAALHRLAEAKGAVELILADCYIRRDKVALVAFRGKGADVLLPPTRSLERARRSLAALPGGGGTPLGAGIDASAAVADSVKRGGGTPLLVFLTDGRANVARDGAGDRAAAADEALAAARRIRAAKHRSLVIDVSPEPNEAARRLAEEMAATYLPLPHADAARISHSVAKAMPQ
jgi:magnesium chelatase subunit D